LKAVNSSLPTTAFLEALFSLWIPYTSIFLGLLCAKLHAGLDSATLSILVTLATPTH